ncbi:MAG TPA: two-component regulator propeller domain-containing protein, partial [Luteolibacter sp.]
MRWTGAWRLVLALLAAFGWAEQIMAEKSGKFMVRTWGMESGLPHPRVKALAQTDDGYLWAATSRGLARFDGQRFVVFDDTVHPGLREVSALASGRDNRLWLGCENGAILECREGRFRTVLPADTPGLGKTIMILAEEGNGHLWITTGNFRVSVLRNGSLDQLSERWVGSFGSGFQARCTRDKRLIVNSHLGLWEPVNDSLRSIIRFDGKYHGYHAPGSGDRFWLSDSKHLFRWRGGNPEEAKPLAAPAWGVRKLMFGIEDINSQLWLATDGHGLLSYGEDGTMSEVGISDGLGAGYILSLLEDREGCVWAGTDGGGLSRVQPRVFTRWDHADGLVSNRVNAVLSTRDGSLVIGTKGDGTMRLKNGRVERVGDSSARWMTTDVAALAETPDGKLWIGTWNAGLLFCEGEKCSAATSLPAPNSSVPALLTDPDGSLWVGRSGNPHLLRIGPQGTEVFPLKSGALDVRALAKADDGWLWIGTEADGLFRWKDGKTEALGIPAGQRMTGMRSILAQGDTLWIGTDGAGFWRWKNGSFQTCATADGLPDDNVRGIRIDAAGGMWVSCVKGLVRIDVASLNAWFDGRGSFPAPVVFGESDGVAGIGGYGDG